MPLSKLTHDRYAHAATLTDAEVDELYEYYSGLNKAFGGYTPREYLLVENNVHSNYIRLKEMRKLRGIDKAESIVRLYARHQLDRPAFLQALMNEHNTTLEEAQGKWHLMIKGGHHLDQMIRTAVAELKEAQQ